MYPPAEQAVKRYRFGLCCIRELVSCHQEALQAIPAFQAVLQVIAKHMVDQQLQHSHGPRTPAPVWTKPTRRDLSSEVLELLQLVPLPHQDDYDKCLDWAVREGA